MNSLHLWVQLSQELVCTTDQIKDYLSHVYLSRYLICGHGSWSCQVLFDALEVRQELLVNLELAEL